MAALEHMSADLPDGLLGGIWEDWCKNMGLKEAEPHEVTNATLSDFVAFAAEVRKAYIELEA